MRHQTQIEVLRELSDFDLFRRHGSEGALACSSKTAKCLQTEIARPEPWQVVARSREKTEVFVKFTAEAFYKRYA
jgi:hypothetical protein